jgi:hypothetical protein
MGWRAWFKDGTYQDELQYARPMKEGKKGKLLAISQEDYHHNIAVDLAHGIIFIDYDVMDIQNGTIEIKAPKSILFICYETLIGADLTHIDASEPNEEGWYTQTERSLIWRPIWFTRHISTLPGPVKVIGAQTTLPTPHGKKNVKKLISLFPDGRVGIS